jgi:ribonuclease P/MRP protein subunit POP5
MEHRVKTLLPSWREKKRYLAFEVLSQSRIKAVSDVSKAVWRSHLAACGEMGAARAGMLFMDKWDPARQRGLLRVSHDQLHQVRMSLALIERINEQPVVVRSVGVSGILRKAEARYVAS